MKKLLSFILLSILSAGVHGQLTKLSVNPVLPYVSDSLSLDIYALFYSEGFNSYPLLGGYSTIQSSDTLNLNLYYTNEPLQHALFCTRFNSIRLTNIPLQIQTIKISGYVCSTDTSLHDTLHEAQDVYLNLLTLGILQGIGQAGKIKVSPNPATDYLQVDAGNEKFTDVYITDITGWVVKRFGHSSDRLDISDLPVNVLYILNMRGDNTIYTCKFSKR